MSVNVHAAKLFLEVAGRGRMPTDGQPGVLAAAARAGLQLDHRQRVELASVDVD